MTAAPPNWHLAAAKFLRDEAEAQRQINARYPDHVKCYPSWTQRIRWAEGLALKLEGLHACTNAAQYCEPCRQLGKDPKHVRAAPQPEPVAFRCWHPKAERCYYVSTSPPEPFRSDTGEPNAGNNAPPKAVAVD